MATILDLFKSRKTEIYGGVGGQTFIESQGAINIPRKAALLASSPNAVGALIGNEIGGLVKGSSDRPSDLVFKDKKFFSKPVIISPRAISRGLKYAFDTADGETNDYYIKKQPEPPAFLNKIAQGVSTPGSVIQEESAKILKNPTTLGEGIKFISERLKGLKNDSESYGPSKTEDVNLKYRKEEKKFSKWAPIYNRTVGNNGESNFTQGSLVKRENEPGIDSVIRHIIGAENIKDQSGKPYDLTEFKKLNDRVGGSYVLIENYFQTTHILLPGTVSGISEDFTPEWNAFKYLGSPFSLYRYGGVERSLKFNVKLYYTDHSSKLSMIKKLDALRELVFPSADIAAITYPGASQNQALLAIKPNLLWLSISGVYKELFGVIDSLSFSIDDNVSWASTIPDTEDINNNLVDTPKVTISNGDESKYDTPHPTVIDVSISMKIIENPQIVKENSEYSYVYRKDDKSYFTKPYELNQFLLEQQKENSTQPTFTAG